MVRSVASLGRLVVVVWMVAGWVHAGHGSEARGSKDTNNSDDDHNNNADANNAEWDYAPDHAVATSANPCGTNTSALGACGPANWGFAFGECDAESHPHQSPVDIDAAHVHASHGLDELRWKVEGAYGCRHAAVHRLDFTWDVRLDHERCAHAFTLSRFSHDFALVGFDFHAPAEHAVDGVREDMEVHFHHHAADDDGARLVVAVRLHAYDDEEDNPFVAAVWRVAHNASAVGRVVQWPRYALNFVDGFLPSKGLAFDFYTYEGSSTTPPCHAVRWVVMKGVVPISTSQLRAFQTAFQNSSTAFGGESARPLQHLHDHDDLEYFHDHDCYFRYCHNIFEVTSNGVFSRTALCLAGLIVFTMLFESITALLEHAIRNHRSAFELVGRIYKELSVLGLVSFVSFSITQTCQIEVAEDILVAFELAHVLIFAVAVLYVVFASVELLVILRSSSHWDKLLSLQGRDFVAYVEGYHKSWRSFSPFVLLFKEPRLFDYGMFRSSKLFIDRNSLESSFPFVKYFHYYLSHNIQDMLDVRLSTWAGAMLFMAPWPLLLSQDPRSFVLIGAVLTATLMLAIVCANRSFRSMMRRQGVFTVEQVKEQVAVIDRRNQAPPVSLGGARRLGMTQRDHSPVPSARRLGTAQQQRDHSPAPSARRKLSMESAPSPIRPRRSLGGELAQAAQPRPGNNNNNNGNGNGDNSSNNGSGNNRFPRRLHSLGSPLAHQRALPLAVFGQSKSVNNDNGNGNGNGNDGWRKPPRAFTSGAVLPNFGHGSVPNLLGEFARSKLAQFGRRHEATRELMRCWQPFGSPLFINFCTRGVSLIVCFYAATYLLVMRQFIEETYHHALVWAFVALSTVVLIPELVVVKTMTQCLVEPSFELVGDVEEYEQASFKVREAVVDCLYPGLDDELMDEPPLDTVLDLFVYFDPGCKVCITMNQLVKGLQMVGDDPLILSARNVTVLKRLVDKDRSNSIDPLEMLELVFEERVARVERRVQQTFAVFGGSLGTVSLDALPRVAEGVYGATPDADRLQKLNDHFRGFDQVSPAQFRAFAVAEMAKAKPKDIRVLNEYTKKNLAFHQKKGSFLLFRRSSTSARLSREKRRSHSRSASNRRSDRSAGSSDGLGRSERSVLGTAKQWGRAVLGWRPWGAGPDAGSVLAFAPQDNNHNHNSNINNRHTLRSEGVAAWAEMDVIVRPRRDSEGDDHDHDDDDDHHGNAPRVVVSQHGDEEQGVRGPLDHKRGTVQELLEPQAPLELEVPGTPELEAGQEDDDNEGEGDDEDENNRSGEGSGQGEGEAAAVLPNDERAPLVSGKPHVRARSESEGMQMLRARRLAEKKLREVERKRPTRSRTLHNLEAG